MTRTPQTVEASATTALGKAPCLQGPISVRLPSYKVHVSWRHTSDGRPRAGPRSVTARALSAERSGPRAASPQSSLWTLRTLVPSLSREALRFPGLRVVCQPATQMNLAGSSEEAPRRKPDRVERQMHSRAFTAVASFLARGEAAAGRTETCQRSTALSRSAGGTTPKDRPESGREKIFHGGGVRTRPFLLFFSGFIEIDN